MGVIPLSALDLALAAALVLALAGLAWAGRFGVARALLVAAARTVVQLLLVGLVLKAVFGLATLPWVAALALAMLLVAGREVMARQRRRLAGPRSSGRRPGTSRATPSPCSGCCSATP